MFKSVELRSFDMMLFVVVSFRWCEVMLLNQRKTKFDDRKQREMWIVKCLVVADEVEIYWSV